MGPSWCLGTSALPATSCHGLRWEDGQGPSCKRPQLHHREADRTRCCRSCCAEGSAGSTGKSEDLHALSVLEESRRLEDAATHSTRERYVRAHEGDRPCPARYLVL